MCIEIQYKHELDFSWISSLISYAHTKKLGNIIFLECFLEASNEIRYVIYIFIFQSILLRTSKEIERQCKKYQTE